MSALFEAENRALRTMAKERSQLLHEREELLASRLVETKRFLENQLALQEAQERIRAARRQFSSALGDLQKR
jgi:hypothetical protein